MIYTKLDAKIWWTFVIYLYNDMNFTGFLFCRTTVFFISRKVFIIFSPQMVQAKPELRCGGYHLGTAEWCVIFSFRNPNHSCWNNFVLDLYEYTMLLIIIPTTKFEECETPLIGSLFPRVASGDHFLRRLSVQALRPWWVRWWHNQMETIRLPASWENRLTYKDARYEFEWTTWEQRWEFRMIQMFLLLLAETVESFAEFWNKEIVHT